MNFRFDTGKATEEACLFLHKAGGRMNIMKLVKLVYLLDQLSLDRRGIPVVGGDYLSMRNCPVISELLDLINAGQLLGDPGTRWQQCISDRRNHEVQLDSMPAREHVSDAEVALLDEIWTEHGGKRPVAVGELVPPTLSRVDSRGARLCTHCRRADCKCARQRTGSH